jgi:peptidyl-prolyl cis-trans isomerase C
VAQGQQPDSPQLRELIKKDLIGREVLMQEAEKRVSARTPTSSSARERPPGHHHQRPGRRLREEKPGHRRRHQGRIRPFRGTDGDKEYHVRHILLGTEAEANDVIAKIKGGAKFEDLAKNRKTPARQPTAATWTGQSPSSFPPVFSPPSWPCKKARSPRSQCKPLTAST